MTTTSRPPCVWIVDDDETVLMLAEAILAGDGFAVKTFASSVDALATMAIELPGILVLDVMMPGMDGFELCARLRQLPGGGDVPVLMATSLEDPGSIDRAYRAGATGFAIKPLNWTVEGHRLRYMLRGADTARLLHAKEHEARLAKEDWERTFNSISDSVMVLSPDLAVVRANAAAARAVGRRLDDIAGVRCHELFADSAAACPGCPAARAIELRAPVSQEMRHYGDSAECLLTVAPVTDGHGDLLHLVHIARDISDQKRLERQYLHAQKLEAVGTLASGVAHDFNNLLSVIICGAEFLRSEPGLGEEQRESADAIFTSAKRGAMLSRQLLAFSRKGTATAEKRALQVNDVVRDIQSVIGRVFPRNVAVSVACAGDLRLVKGAADELYQVLMNLALNASQAMPAGGTLRIGTENVSLDARYCRVHPEAQAGDHVRVTVSDTGHGMDRYTMEHMFEPFFTTKGVGKGTGLGLPVVHGIVAGHGGHILCSSEVGVGTTFTVHLPALEATHTPAAGPARQRTVMVGGSETVLLVDDDDPVRAVLESGLARLGYTVLTARDGEEALLRFGEAHARVRLVVMDLDMPGMGGWECLSRLRSLDREIRVLIITGQGGHDLQERARQAGAAGLMAKPFEIEALARRVREVLEE